MKEREIVTAPTERVCVDLVGPLPKGRGGVEHILTCIDIATRWPEAVAIKSTTIQTVISKLKEIFARQGMPGVLVSDNGPQFSSRMFKDFCRREGIKHVTAAPYCPQSNGIVERFHKTLKGMIAKVIDRKGNGHRLCQCA